MFERKIKTLDEESLVIKQTQIKLKSLENKKLVDPALLWLIV